MIIVAGYAAVSLGGWLLTSLQPDEELPAGWTLIRPPGEVYAMVIDGDYVWTGGHEGLFKVDRIGKTLIEQVELPREVDYVNAIYIDERDRVWIGHFNGLTIKDGNSFEHIGEGKGLPDSRVNCIYLNSDLNLMVGTWGGVAINDGDSWDVITVDNGLMVDMVNVIMEDSRGGYWFGHYLAPAGGISYLCEGNWQYFSVDNGLPHNNITSFFEDDEGYVWAGTGLFERGGLIRFAFQDGKWVIDEVFNKDDGLAGEKVRFVFQDNREVYWITSEFDGIAVFPKESLFGDGESTILTEENGLANYEVKVVIQDRDGLIWLGTHNGLNVLDAEALESIP